MSEKPKKVLGFMLAPECVKTKHLAPGAVTPDKLSPDFVAALVASFPEDALSNIMEKMITDDFGNSTNQAISQKTMTETIGDDSQSATIKGRIKSLEDKVGPGKPIDNRINETVESLVGNVSSTSTDDKVTVQVKEADGKLTEVKVTTNDIASKSQFELNKQTVDTELYNIKRDLNTKQAVLEFDNAPEAGSSNPVKSSGIKNALDTKVDKVAGKGLSTEDYTPNEKEKLGSLPTGDALTQQLAGKQDSLVFDNTPTDGSVNMVRSGAIKSYVDAEASRAKTAEQANANSISTISQKVPNEASQDNQLADKNFVNSSIATNTAHYISYGGEPFPTYELLQEYSGTLTNNDYAFVVGTDALGNITYTRYKYNSDLSSWSAEYVLNNSSFTAAQWASISSGITALLTNKLAALPTYEELMGMLASKQDALTIDLTPTANSNNPIASDAVYDLREAVNTSLAGKQDTLIFDTEPVSGSGRPVTSGGVYTAIANSGQIRFEEVDHLPPAGMETLGTIYITRDENSYQWHVTMYETSVVPAFYYWRNVNTNAVDLSEYLKGVQVQAMFDALHKIATSGSFNDLEDKPDTLQGYDITDAYTKQETDDMLDAKQDNLVFASVEECVSAANELT